MEKRIGQQWSFHQKLGDAFIKSFIPSLQMYIDYAENYQNSVAAISSSKFASIVTVTWRFNLHTYLCRN